jgi:hypothetical protein
MQSPSDGREHRLQSLEPVPERRLLCISGRAIRGVEEPPGVGESRRTELDSAPLSGPGQRIDRIEPCAA